MLDNPKKLKSIDRGKMATSIESLPGQIEQMIDEFHLSKVPKKTQNIDLIVVSGMGGSNLGAGIIKSVFSDSLHQPLIVNAGYHVPKFVNSRTLYILSSFSGNTEETLACYTQAKKQHAKMSFITAKGKNNKLWSIMAKDKISGIIFDPRNNPSGQPRMALGYSVFGLLTLLERQGLIKIKSTEIRDLLRGLRERNELYGFTNPSAKNPAKKIAKDIFGKMPILIGAEHLAGNLRALRNQFCENSKNFSDYLIIPEMNHFALEGLVKPSANKGLVFVFFDSRLYSTANRKRMKLSQEVVKKNKIKTISHALTGKSELDQAFELLQLGSWITFYLAVLNKVDPVKIPFVDWFKNKLK